ncbi:MAG: hypothetical protein QM765_36650 [Myxococcales bacterium]
MATTCPRHPGFPTTDLCVGCGDFVCGQCAHVTGDRRVYCPRCLAELPAEDATSAPAPPPAAPPPAKPPAERRPVPLLPAVEIPSPLWRIVRENPISVLVMVLGLVGFGCTPVAVGGAVVGFNEVRKNVTGATHGDTAFVMAAFFTNVAAILLRMAVWQGR